MNRRTLLAAIGAALGGVKAGVTPAAAHTGYEDAIYEACARHGCDGDQLIRVMQCESGGDPNAVSAYLNPMNGMHDIGLFQFNPDTWAEFGGGDIWNPWEQIEVAASMWANGYGWRWVCQ
ncbi:MAG: transglycosylase SLT domain-containing protein [Pseudomonadota bacterium]|nr:transglycosylase SLT domain-containing protein [Pseudomonadota bacterium]